MCASFLCPFGPRLNINQIIERADALAALTLGAGALRRLIRVLAATQAALQAGNAFVIA
jgi:hypothetical protein